MEYLTTYPSSAMWGEGGKRCPLAPVTCSRAAMGCQGRVLVRAQHHGGTDTRPFILGVADTRPFILGIADTRPFILDMNAFM